MPKMRSHNNPYSKPSLFMKKLVLMLLLITVSCKEDGIHHLNVGFKKYLDGLLRSLIRLFYVLISISKSILNQFNLIVNPLRSQSYILSPIA